MSDLPVMPQYVSDRLTKKPPEDFYAYVQENTYPSVGSGRFEDAKVVTIGINPAEGRPNSIPPEEAWEFRRDYFKNCWHPPYHGPMERMLNACCASYLDGSAVSLDIAQWATKCKWRKVPEDVRAMLLQDGVPYLRAALEKNASIKVVLANGKTVVDALKRFHDAKITHWEELTREEPGKRPMRLYCGEVHGKKLIGWNEWITYVPAKARQRVGELYCSGC